MSGMHAARGTSLHRDLLVMWNWIKLSIDNMQGELDFAMKKKPEVVVPLRRCGDLMGRASAGLIILGTVSFAVAALVVDLL